MVTAILTAGQRRPDTWILALFLTITAVNFFANAFAVIWLDGRWAQLSQFSLALGGFYLPLFASMHPFRRRPSSVKILLVVIGLWTVVSLVVVAVRFDRILVGPTAAGFSLQDRATWENAVLHLGFALGYVSAWMLSVRSASHAPTATLKRRAGWTAAAMAVVVIPRVGLIPAELGVPAGTPVAVDLAIGAAIMAGLYALGLRQVRSGDPSGELGSTLRVGGIVVAVIWGLWAVQLISGLAASEITITTRWVAFAALFLYAILVFEVVEFEGTAARVLPLVGAAITFAGVVLTTAFLATSADAPPWLAGSVSAGVGLAAVVPAAVGIRALVRRIEPPEIPGGGERRLELYRAAVERAWAAGPPDADERDRLDAYRRSYGVSPGEARAIEHVVASEVGTQAGPAPGDEPVAGLVLGEPLGRGGQGRVFRARRYPGDERVVVKVLETGAASTSRRKQLLREVDSLSAIDHPNVVDLLDVHVAGGRHLLVLEHVDGPDLAEVVADGPVDADRTRDLVAGILDGLAAIHDLGIVHGDLKPSNVLVRDDGTPVLADFGLARKPDDGGPSTTITGLDAISDLEGTLPYMAPEQVRTGRTGVASDLYAVGLIAYETLVGEPALDVRGRTAFETIDRVQDPWIDLDRVPARWRDVLARALDPDPDGRFDDADAMRRALDGIARG